VAQVSPQLAEACAVPCVARVARPAELPASEPVQDELLQSALVPRASVALRAGVRVDARYAPAVRRAERLRAERPQDGSAAPQWDDLLRADCSAPVAPQLDDSVAPEQPEQVA